MKNFLCRECRCHIRVGDHLILGVKSPKGERGLVLLSPEEGDYSKTLHPYFQIEDGVPYRFYCPACHKLLLDKDKEDMVRLIMEEDGQEFDFYFSNVGGEQVTFKITENKVEEFGDRSSRFAKYFDLPEEYKKYL